MSFLRYLLNSVSAPPDAVGYAVDMQQGQGLVADTFCFQLNELQRSVQQYQSDKQPMEIR